MNNYFVKLLPGDYYNPTSLELFSKDQVLNFEKKVSRFFNKISAIYTFSGREAISLALSTLNLKLEDEIYIATTFNYKNVSSCVTSTVFNYCKPSRVITKQTKAIFIIHEFGVFHPETLGLIEFGRENNMIIIEDCAHTPFSFDNKNNQTGCLGDFTIVSLPKIFPVNTGGLLVSAKEFEVSGLKYVDKHLQTAVIADRLWDTIQDISEKRKTIFNSYLLFLKSTFFKPLIHDSNRLFPWFFPIVTKIDPVDAVQSLRASGVEAGHWYGSNVLVLPLHQYLSKDDIFSVSSIVNKISG